MLPAAAISPPAPGNRLLVEGYDGLLFMRTLDGQAGLVEMAWPAEREAEAVPLLAALGLEIGLHEVPGGAAKD